jgi:hypothetical protein
VIYSSFTLSIDKSPNVSSLWSIFTELSGQVNKTPAILIFILFACYLFGSIVRAMPVFWAARIITPTSVQFPYEANLKKAIEKLNENVNASRHDLSRVPDLNGGLPIEVFNYWKDRLCIKSPEGFDYYKTFETRVRFFAGMIWASVIGLFGGGYIFFVKRDPQHLSLMLISILLLIIFGSNFSRIRKSEARALLTLYTAHLQDEYNEQGQR